MKKRKRKSKKKRFLREDKKTPPVPREPHNKKQFREYNKLLSHAKTFLSRINSSQVKNKEKYMK